MYFLIPYFIHQNYAHGNMKGDFQAVGLFIDISGFSTMTEALMAHGPHGAEVLAGVMQSVFDSFAECIYAQNGMIITIEGDALTALFSVDEHAGHTSSQALAAAWEIQQLLEKNRQVQTPYGSFEIQVKMGLAGGDVHWGILTSAEDARATVAKTATVAERATYYFQGSAVDVCAEAEHFAKAGEIVMDFALFEQMRFQVSGERVESFVRIAKLQPEQVSQLPAPVSFDIPATDPKILSRFFPEALLQQRAGDLQRAGEFRQIVNVFISLPTIRNETQLASFADTMFDLADRYGGLYKRIDFGDKGSNLLLFWGAPLAYENDVERALNFIFDLQTLTSIPINAGITYQIAHAGFIRSSLLEEYTCYGWGLNLAARFMTAARRGEIWVDEGIMRKARHLFDFDFEGEKEFKGFARKQPVYILVERKLDDKSFFSGKMVGRQAELVRLEEFCEPLWRSNGDPLGNGKSPGAMVVLGEAGIGKSRLLHVFAEKLEDQGKPLQWATCQTDEILREPLNPIRYWLLRYFEQTEANPEARNKRSFNRILDDLIEETMVKHVELAEELDRTRSFLGGLVNLFWSDSLFSQLDPESRGENIQIALTSFFKAISLQKPVIIFLEDVHWLDEETRNFLPRFARSLLSDESQVYPVGILATARNRGRQALLGDNLPYDSILLDEVQPDDLVRMAANELGAPVSDDLGRLLIERADGNPFYTEQIIRYLQEGNFIEYRHDQYHLVEEYSQQPLPADVRSLLVARLDRLDLKVKNVVHAAAVIGREFAFNLLDGVLENEENLSEKVNNAEAASIWVALDEVRYLFKHNLLRDVAYEMMLLTQRKKYHARIVEAIERIYAGDLSQHFGQLAFHSETSGNDPKALLYLQKAGEQARDVYRNRLAFDFYRRALKLAGESERSLRFDLLVEIENLNNLLGNYSDHLGILDALAEILDEQSAMIGEEISLFDWQTRMARISDRYATYYMVIGDYAKAAELAEQAVGLAQEAGFHAGTLEATITWAMALYRQASYSLALDIVAEAIQTARQENELSWLGKLLNMSGLIAMETRELSSVQQCFEESRKIAQEVGNLMDEAMVLNNLGILAGSLGDYSQVLACYLESLAIAQKVGYRRGEGLVLGNLGWVSGILGDYTSSRSYCEQNLRINREVGSLEGEAYALINLSAAYIHIGETSQALSYLARANEIACDTGDRSAEAWSWTYQGHAWCAMDDLDAAARAYQHAVFIRRELTQENLAAEPLAGLARAALKKGEFDAARDYTDSILSYLDAGGSLEGTDEPLHIYLSCYQVLEKDRNQRAGSILQQAYQMLQSRAEKINDERMRRSFLESVPFHREIISEWEAAFQS